MRSAPLALAAALAAAVASACGAGTDAPPSAPAAVRAPAQARLLCEGTQNRLLTPAARPRRDGLHLLVENRGPARSLVVGGLGENAPRGRSLHVLPVPPGTVRVGCMGNGDPGRRGGLVPLRVADPNGVWISDRLLCPRQFSGIADYAAGARGLRHGLAADARRAIHARAGDRVGRAGYPGAETRERRLLRGGEVLGTVEYAPDGHGGWLRSQVTRCA